MTNTLDESFIANAGLVFERAMSITLPAEAVWNELTSDRAMRWALPGLRVHWGNPRTGVGATRTMGLVIGPTRVERYFLWEDNIRKAFYMESPPMPGLDAFVEEYRLQPIGSDVIFTWVWAMDTSGMMGRYVTRPILRAMYGFMMWRSRRYFDRLSYRLRPQ